jgi:2'-5' RNA ligase
MTALPTQMIDRWEHRVDPAPGQATVYWHVLMRDHPEVIALARHAQQRLAAFPGLHVTPLEWLHMTTMVAGPAGRFSSGQLDLMAETAAKLLADVPPITVTLGRILYHPEAIMLGVHSASALAPIRNAAAAATNMASSDRRVESDVANWIPHVTICYSISRQPAAPLIAALGENLPACEVQVNTLSLIIQHGPERSWDWSTAATIRLASTATA